MPYIPLEVFANNPSTTTTSTYGTTAPAQGTTETWVMASSASFPAVETGAQQFHIGDPALPSEIITVQNISGTTWTVVRGASGLDATTPVAHAAAATFVQVVTAGVLAAGQYSAWQFPVQAYGAQGDGKMGTGGTGASGQAVFTDAGAAFVNATVPAGDVGKYIIINQGANSNTPPNPFVGTIISVNSGTSVTLNANLAATCTAAPYIYGTDDTAAINATVTAAAAWATGTGNYKAQVLFEPCNYMLGAAPYQSTSPNKFNAQIPVPVGAALGKKLCFDFVGIGDASEPDYFGSVVPNLQGTCLISASWVTSVNGTYGQQSVIGGPTDTTGLGTGGFANTLVNFSGITIVCPWNSGQMGMDFRYLAQANVPNASFLAFAPVNLYQTAGIGGVQFWWGASAGQYNVPTANLSTGLYMPLNNNNDNCNIGFFSVEGASYGLAATEHTNVTRLFAAYCANGIFFVGGTHGSVLQYASIEECTNAIYATNGGPVFIAMLDTEETSGYHVSDSSGYLTGQINLRAYNQAISVLGGQNVCIYDFSANRTIQGAPAYSLGTAFQNPWWRNAWIQLASGTTTGISVGPTSAAATTSVGTTTPASFSLPSGYWLNIAGSVKPTTFTAVTD